MRNREPMNFKEFGELYMKTLIEEAGKVRRAFVALIKAIFKRKVRK